MERKKLLEWVKISQEIINNREKIFVCPENNLHIIEYNFEYYSKYNKKELHLRCKICDLHLTFTIITENDENLLS
ncbi:MAG TPA: hypothetical protein DCM08_07390 [Microscillaceae bacterium]|nr:hypothetical protein [Microscillaceae bacterium]